MSNYLISHNKTMYDIFNMTNPNCYQAFIIQYIIENKKEDAIKCCDELSVAFNYYKWDTSGKQSNYIDGLINESGLENWQKLALLHIISNNVNSCKTVIENEIKIEEDTKSNYFNLNKINKANPLQDIYNFVTKFNPSL